MTIQDLAVDHSYYSSDSNYYSNDCSAWYDSWANFYSEFHDADMDMNLVFRWDIKAHDDERPDLGHYMEIFIIGQRKGLYLYHHIRNVFDRDVDSILSFLRPRMMHLIQMWEPISCA